jgi:hypothetical protein
MRELLLLAIHLLVTVVKLLRPGGARAVAAESLALQHQLLISNRSRQRAPNLTSIDRFVLGLITLFVSPRRMPKLSAILKPATFFKFHKALVNRKYHLLFSSSSYRRKPGPKGPSAEVIAAIVERSGAIRVSAVCASPSRSLTPSPSNSTKMWFVELSVANSSSNCYWRLKQSSTMRAVVRNNLIIAICLSNVGTAVASSARDRSSSHRPKTVGRLGRRSRPRASLPAVARSRELVAASPARAVQGAGREAPAH